MDIFLFDELNYKWPILKVVLLMMDVLLALYRISKLHTTLHVPSRESLKKATAAHSLTSPSKPLQIRLDKSSSNGWYFEASSHARPLQADNNDDHAKTKSAEFRVACCTSNFALHNSLQPSTCLSFYTNVSSLYLVFQTACLICFILLICTKTPANLFKSNLQERLKMLYHFNSHPNHHYLNHTYSHHFNSRHRPKYPQHHHHRHLHHHHQFLFNHLSDNERNIDNKYFNYPCFSDLLQPSLSPPVLHHSQPALVQSFYNTNIINQNIFMAENFFFQIFQNDLNDDIVEWYALMQTLNSR